MLKSIKVTNPKGESLTLELTKPEDSGLIVQEITGLGPSQANIVTNEIVNSDGGIFTHARMENRNIVLTFGLIGRSAPNYESVEQARLKTYRYFPIKKPIELVFETDQRIATCTGYVERNEPNIFSSQETVQISIICPDPYFYDVGKEEIAFSGVIPKFEFPFSNESVTKKLIEFGEIRMNTLANLVYNGDMDTGFIAKVRALNDCNDITILNIDTRESMKLDADKIKAITGKSITQGDEIIISTKKGEKYIRLLREGKYTNIISCVNKNADWFQISSGDNIFGFEAGGSENDIMITFVYRNAYGGI